MGKKTDFLYLSEPDMIRAGVLDSDRCVDVIDEVFRLLGTGDYIMGGINGNEHGLKIHFPKETLFPNMPVAEPDRRFMSMVAYLGGRFHVCGEKWYGSNIANPSIGLPRSILMSMLNDPVTCEPLCLMSANLLSSVRTGAVPGVAVRYLSDRSASVLTIIGAGPINKACFQAIVGQAVNLKEVLIYDLFEEKAAAFASWVNETAQVHARVEPVLQNAVEQGDIISVAASRLKPVELKNEWFKKGSLMIMTGPAFVDEEYWSRSRIIFDNPKMHAVYMQDAIESGDKAAAYSGMICGQVYRMIDEKKLPPILSMPSLGKIILKEEACRLSRDDVLTFITGGMAVLDVGWGYEMYQNALKQGIGTRLNLWQEPHWT